MAIVPLSALQALVESEHFAEAIPLLDELLQADQGSAEVLRLMARSLQGVGRLEEAIVAWQMCTLVDPWPSASLHGLAETLWEAGQHDEAREALEASLSINSGYGAALISKSRFFCDSEQFEQALAAANQALIAQPEAASAHEAKARALSHLGQHQEAERSYTAAIKRDPSLPRPRFKRAIENFILGNFQEGVADYEQRWNIEEAPVRIQLNCKDWHGERYHGNLLIYGEQGIGDEIFFIGLLQLMPPITNPFIIAVDPRLTELISRSLPSQQVISHQSSALTSLRIQRTLPAGSLLARLVHAGVALPKAIPAYLRVPPAIDLLQESPEDRVSEERFFRIGLCWRSGHPRVGERKSIDLAQLDWLSQIQGSCLVSLQHGEVEVELTAYAQRTGTTILQPCFDPFQEIDLLASLIASCDCIVTIPGITAHLAGALGINTVVLSRSSRGRVWYWEGVNEQSAWYPNVAVYRGHGDADLERLLTQAKGTIEGWAQAAPSG